MISFCILFSLVGVSLARSVRSIEDNDLEHLKLVSVITRHGDRTPITLYPNDPHENYEYIEGRGQLTILGKRQHYKLGEYLRERYTPFISSNPREVSARSSAKHRTLASAHLNLAAFFRPSEEWIFTDELRWQPIPVFSDPPTEDGMLYEGSRCPAAKAEQTRIRNSPAGQEYISQFTQLFEEVTQHSGMNVSDWDSAADIFSTLAIEKRRGLLLPDWVTEDVFNTLKSITQDSFRLSYNTTKIQRLRGGVVIGDVVKHMQQKVNGEIDPIKKVFFYSTHDVVIAAVLNALGVFNDRAPPFCATVLIELHSPPEGNAFVRVHYSNSSTPETGEQEVHLLTLPGCSSDCPLNEFIDLTKHVIPENWKEECFATTSESGEHGDE
uniref:Histidine phosphatase n=1 Tax=Hadrurus spadix TaxID=141984 RepID=A0A1W7RAF6_9SCOR